MTNTALLTFKDACALLGISRPTLYRIVNDYKQLPIAHVAKLGKQRRMYFRECDVIALRQLRTPAAE